MVDSIIAMKAPTIFLRHSGTRHPNSGLPEFGKYDCPSRQQPTWMARARNPSSRPWLWIPGSLAAPVSGPAEGRTRWLAPRNDKLMPDPKNLPRFRRACDLAAGAARAGRDALDQLAVRGHFRAVGLIEGILKPGAQVTAQISAALMQRPDFRPPDRGDLPMRLRQFQF